jgi:2-keto-4-pentenoate hydratase/2-oxohepta-3-ene-1,7-dioic acid hydratase in catechol pathway
MRYLRFRKPGEEEIHCGWSDGESVGLVEGVMFGPHRRLPAGIPLSGVEPLTPVVPGKIVCVGRNYRDHAREHDVEVPDVPLLFLKPPSAVIGPREAIRLPITTASSASYSTWRDCVGSRTHGVTPDEARRSIFGYTIANDVTARDLQQRDGQWTRAKGFDTFCPVGPWIETELDPEDTRILCRVEGQIRQMASTRDMVFSVFQLIAFISGIMTLDGGDLILTGTPAGVGRLDPGDRVQVEIEGIGVLENPVHGPEGG